MFLAQKIRALLGVLACAASVLELYFFCTTPQLTPRPNRASVDRVIYATHSMDAAEK
ncbi:MAG TPA: hypothetical protein VMU43_11860 [Candidatus Acidoferrum sp.]|nr:hypothetical protein [Candidatus Acidoferrum sp.]